MPPKQQKAPKQPLKIYYSEEEKRRDMLRQQQQNQNQNQSQKQQQSKAKPAARAGPVRSKRTFSAAQSSAPYSVDRLPNRFEKKKAVAVAAAAPASRATTTAPAARKAKRSYALSLKTAEAIASDRTHPKQTEVIELLKTLERGWIDTDRFSELLAELIL